jgi:hypothetical protein
MNRFLPTATSHLWSLLLCVALVGCQREQPQQQTGPPQRQAAPAAITAEMIAENNRAVAIMMQLAPEDFKQAYVIFQKLVDAKPDWLDVKVNAAIALLNMPATDQPLTPEQTADLDRALRTFKEVLALDPRNPRANYCAGLLLFHGGHIPEALEYFRKAADAKPNDAYAAYQVAMCLFNADEFDEALKWFRTSQKNDPFLASAYYGAFQTLQRLGKKSEADEMLTAFKRFNDNPQARKFAVQYTRMGLLAEAIVVNLEPPPPRPPLPKGPVFAQAEDLAIGPLGGETAWATADPKRPTPSITICDIDGDGRPDIFIAGALVQGGKRLNAVLFARDGGFQLDMQHPLSAVTDVNAVLWGDYDNDGLTDVYFCRRGGNQLWRQVEKSKWSDVTEKTRTAGNGGNTVDGAMFDADHDGDLDLFLINADGPNEQLINNMDGTFRPIAKDRGIAGDGRPSRGLVIGPFTGNRVADIMVIHDEPPNEIYRNDRLWAYHKPEGFETLLAAKLDAAAMADPEAIGRFELITATRGELARWRADAKDVWQSHAIAGARSGIRENSDANRGTAPRNSHEFRYQLAITDVLGSGQLAAIASDDDGWRCVGLNDDHPVLYEEKQPDLACWSLFVPDAAKGPAIVGFVWGKGPVIWKPGPGRYPFMALEFSGQHDKNRQMRSNASGIGVQAAVRVDSRWTAVNTYRNQSGPGQSLQPIAVGLGGAAAADFIRITWPDGALQTEIGLASGKLHRIEEQNRLPVSCPLLFVWNGQKFEFVSDCLGVGGLGYAVGPGEYAPVRPWENLLLPPSMQPRDGRFQIKIAEPMEEMTYLDSAALAAYDLPLGWRMTLDERAAVNGPQPTGEPRFYRDEMLPARATNDRGEDVTELVIAADERPAPPGRPDPRFIGRCEEHSLTMTFPRPIDSHAGSPMLVADGWIEYPYSQTMFAAWQAGAAYHAPSLDARDAAGNWHTILPEFGYPGGMSREMSLPLAGLPKGCREIRVRTNQEVYWDRLAIAWSEPCPEAKRQTLALKTAQLNYAGFPERTIGPERQTTFDYNRRRAIEDVRYLTGFYTRYGDVRELVSQIDDAVATIGPGEELHVEYTAPTHASAAGWSRRFVLEARGWCKDTDLFTKDGDTVEPMPHRDDSTAETLRRRDELHRHYNTRYQAGR